MRLVRHGRQGEEVVLHDARPGEFPAEASLDSSRYHCDAVASQPSVVLRAAKADFQRLLADDPDFARSWMALLAAQLRTARARVERLSLRSAEERIRRLLLSEGRGSLCELRITGSLKDLARRLGLTHCFGELPRSSGCGLRRLYFENGHWRGDFVADRMTASGRQCEVTNGSFVEAKQENRWLAVRLLWSNPADRFGSAASVRRQWEQSLAGTRRRAAHPPARPAAAERQVSMAQQTAARGVAQRQVSAPADTRRPNPNGCRQSGPDSRPVPLNDCASRKRLLPGIGARHVHVAKPEH